MSVNQVIKELEQATISSQLTSNSDEWTRYILSRLSRWKRMLERAYVQPPNPDQLSMPMPPPDTAVARTADPSTSHEAAKTVNLSAGRLLVLKALDEFEWMGPVSDEVIHDRITRVMKQPISRSGARTRRHECQIAGWIEATGQAATNSNGRSVCAWRITPAGVKAIITRPHPVP